MPTTYLPKFRRDVVAVARRGDLKVNEVTEGFDVWHALLRYNVLNHHRWRTQAALRYAIVTWIERTYNRRRRQRALGKLTPGRVRTHIRHRCRGNVAIY